MAKKKRKARKTKPTGKTKGKRRPAKRKTKRRAAKRPAKKRAAKAGPKRRAAKRPQKMPESEPRALAMEAADAAPKVEVTFTRSIKGNIEGLAVAVDSVALVFDASDKAVRPLSPGDHRLSWDSFGTHPASFKIGHAPAQPASTDIEFKPGQPREDGTRSIKVGAA